MRAPSALARLLLAAPLLAVFPGCASEATRHRRDATIQPAATPEPAPWTDLLPIDVEREGPPDGWVESDFGGGGEVRVAGGRLILDYGSPLTGITWTQPFPTRDYELLVRAARTSGTDFFCGLTFPVGASHATLILGGWGGALVGLSCIDGLDAADNETRQYRSFPAGVPVTLRVRVTADRLCAWLDEEEILDLELSGRSLSLRPEVFASRPLGIAAFTTRAEIELVRYRLIAPPAVPPDVCPEGGPESGGD